MVDFIRSNPGSAAFNRQTESSRRSSLMDARVGEADFERAKREAAVINQRNLESQLAGIKVPQSTVRQPNAKPKTAPQASPGVQPAGGLSAATVPSQPAAQPQQPAPDPRAAMTNAMLSTPGYGVQGAQMAIQTQDANEARYFEGFEKTIRLLEKGEPEMAARVAKQYGQEIPMDVLTDAWMQREIAAAWDRNKELYAKDPRKLIKQMEVDMNAIMGMKTAGAGQGNLAPRYNPDYGNMVEPPPYSDPNKSKPFEWETLRDAYLAGFPNDPNKERNALLFAQGLLTIDDPSVKKMAYTLAQKEAEIDYTREWTADLISKRADEIYASLLGNTPRIPMGPGGGLSAAAPPIPEPRIPQGGVSDYGRGSTPTPSALRPTQPAPSGGAQAAPTTTAPRPLPQDRTQLVPQTIYRTPKGRARYLGNDQWELLGGN